MFISNFHSGILLYTLKRLFFLNPYMGRGGDKKKRIACRRKSYTPSISQYLRRIHYDQHSPAAQSDWCHFRTSFTPDTKLRIIWRRWGDNGFGSKSNYILLYTKKCSPKIVSLIVQYALEKCTTSFQFPSGPN